MPQTQWETKRHPSDHEWTLGKMGYIQTGTNYLTKKKAKIKTSIWPWWPDDFNNKDVHLTMKWHLQKWATANLFFWLEFLLRIVCVGNSFLFFCGSLTNVSTGSFFFILPLAQDFEAIINLSFVKTHFTRQNLELSQIQRDRKSVNFSTRTSSLRDEFCGFFGGVLEMVLANGSNCMQIINKLPFF